VCPALQPSQPPSASRPFLPSNNIQTLTATPSTTALPQLKARKGPIDRLEEGRWMDGWMDGWD
jgi:hypothetical protein